MSAVDRKKVVAIIIFALAFSFVESSVVVYLRALYYPGGFSFPLKAISTDHLSVELIREFSTLVMLLTIGFMAGESKWQRFAYFLIAFGVWDIFYYVWLKLLLNWPASFTEWDILFLIPLPWIGPVIAPVLISIFFIIAALMIIKKEKSVDGFHVSLPGWLMAFAGTIFILYSFMEDTDATIRLQYPQPYHYWFLIAGILLYSIVMGSSFGIPFLRSRKQQ